MVLEVCSHKLKDGEVSARKNPLNVRITGYLVKRAKRGDDKVSRFARLLLSRARRFWRATRAPI